MFRIQHRVKLDSNWRTLERANTFRDAGRKYWQKRNEHGDLYLRVVTVGDRLVYGPMI